ncbi:sugar ABC transporter ATP-binding protein [Nocardioides immobilis]|uniref:Sugar ABC transporter ATP-binding protein n=1 Tax=Nocardioides immobilis TaxID=2049295 RepID=A0A417XXK5_9ACTN|nr:sugar ABC transporter ATP-binding protein [Nocardioides immobilis]RHW24877.1 sugar ABC transporter ATP-binding protein [Nocardioides immobilis]
MTLQQLSPDGVEGATPVLSIRGLSKTFVSTRALNGVDLDLRAGEIHALVGQNGCGKSTLIKVLAGFHQPDPGVEIRLGGEEVELSSTADAHRAGLRFVHQDLGLVGTLNTVENLMLGRRLTTARGGRIRWDAERSDAERRMKDLGYGFDVARPVAALGAAERTGVAIARALWDWEAARVLVVDEPTASLPREEVAVLFAALQRVRAAGLGVIYVSHRLDEIFAIGDRVTVLRDGVRVGTWDVDAIDQDGLVRSMIGDEKLRPPHDQSVEPTGEVALAVTGLNGTVVEDVDLRVRRGEVVGIAGLTGSGREELLPLIFGVASRTGEVELDGRPVPANPRRAMRAGLALVPADRRGEGAILEMPVRENFGLTDLRRFATRFGFLSRARETKEVTEWIRRLDVRPPLPEALFGALSGGNQQKVVLAKWLRRQPAVLLLDEPSQGVDVGAKAVIHALARQVAADGACVVIASSDDNELCDTCDRVLVMRDGRIVAEVTGSRLTTAELSRLQLGLGATV